ncbi:MAG: endolytic transglycosylase MltG [Termitinemataceae bacterium]|nr:MAG: endolytic transglycosylase MltG [Termitinemataceae bacterium]
MKKIGISISKYVRTLKLFRSLLGVVLFVGALSVGIFIYFNAAPVAVPKSTETVTVDNELKTVNIEIHGGESANSVGRRLQSAGIIKNVTFWKLIAHTNKQYIKKGIYHFEYPQTQIAIHKIFEEGKEVLYRITVPEGITIKKIGAILDEKEICDEYDFIDACKDSVILHRFDIPGGTMEGFLFPDTYLFPQGYSAKNAVIKMGENFFRHMNDMEIDIRKLSKKELYEKITLASIIEREYRVDDEAPIMGGVFTNRISKNIKLESCATVEYIITEIQNKPHPERLFNRDIAISNPYNTYIVSGLPPGPISCPGEVAIKAAFFPAQSEYLFFRVVDPSAGRHYFSKTFDDHIKAGELYVKGQS